MARSRCEIAAPLLLAALAVSAPAAAAQPAIPDEPSLVVLPPNFADSVVVVLQHTETTVQELIDSAAGWKVVEPSVNGRPSGDLSPVEVMAMKTTPERECSSVVLAYLSIGEAEDYRGYWRREWVDASGVPIPGIAPGWLGPENPEWPGNYKVRYWNRAWKDLLFGVPSGPGKSALDRIIDQGFDGVYLDIIDAFEFWSLERQEIARPVARERMVRLVEQIHDYAESRRGDSEFRVFVQNGEGIVLDDSGRTDALTSRYGAAVDGVGMEDLFYDGTRRVPDAEVQARLASLGPLYADRFWCMAIGCGPKFFAIDYVLRGDNLNTLANRTRASRLHELAGANGLLPYAARLDRALDEVVELGGPRWSIVQPYDRCGLMCPVCLAGLDLTGGSAGSLAPDGTVDAADAAFFFEAYARGDLAADLTGSGHEGAPGYGQPDGVVDASDVAYFTHWYGRR